MKDLIVCLCDGDGGDGSVRCHVLLNTKTLNQLERRPGIDVTIEVRLDGFEHHNVAASLLVNGNAYSASHTHTHTNSDRFIISISAAAQVHQ